ncbi:MAG TPA: isoprenylcysteine carboxylmethyltransferase family protein [Aggregatilineaceae bacterium]|nr:isoprenylcysteine carboxylmethyltransferase family protein [Anaerolineae bacterium]HMM27850.1 isoprenylcysteine carboxylmethyltransferase family protein [Aggregatilineaceae bacterium]
MPDSELPNGSRALPWWKNTRGEWYVIAQIALFALVGMGPLLPDVALDLPAGLRIALIGAGLALLTSGGVLALAGLLALGSNLSILPHPKAGAALVERGPYTLVRHPIYSGVILGAIGWALLFRSPITLLIALVLLVFFDAKSRREERWLARAFPGYRAYQRRVRKLIPFVY